MQQKLAFGIQLSLKMRLSQDGRVNCNEKWEYREGSKLPEKPFWVKMRAIKDTQYQETHKITEDHGREVCHLQGPGLGFGLVWGETIVAM